MIVYKWLSVLFMEFTTFFLMELLIQYCVMICIVLPVNVKLFIVIILALLNYFQITYSSKTLLYHPKARLKLILSCISYKMNFLLCFHVSNEIPILLCLLGLEFFLRYSKNLYFFTMHARVLVIKSYLS